MGDFCNTCFLTMIWCSKHFQGVYFHPPLLTWKYFENSWNFFSLKFCHFFKFSHFTCIFLTKSCTKNDLNKDWTEIYSNESVLPNCMKDKILKNTFHNLIFLVNLCLIHFLYIISKENIRKMSKIWKNDKISGKKIFMNSRDIFMWVMVDENTSPGSVLKTISWSKSMYCKKAPSFLTPR